MQIDSDTGLTLGYQPRTDGLAFRPAETRFLIDNYGAVFVFMVRRKRTDSSAGGIVAVHAAARNKDFLFLSAGINFNLLHVNQIVGRQTIGDLLRGGPVLDIFPGPGLGNR